MPFDKAIHDIASVYNLLTGDFESYQATNIYKEGNVFHFANPNLLVTWKHDDADEKLSVSQNIELFNSTLKRRVEIFRKRVAERKSIFVINDRQAKNEQVLRGLAKYAREKLNGELVALSLHDYGELAPAFFRHYSWPYKEYVWYEFKHWHTGSGLNFELPIMNFILETAEKTMPRLDSPQQPVLQKRGNLYTKAAAAQVYAGDKPLARRFLELALEENNGRRTEDWLAAARLADYPDLDGILYKIGVIEQDAGHLPGLKYLEKLSCLDEFSPEWHEFIRKHNARLLDELNANPKLCENAPEYRELKSILGSYDPAGWECRLDGFTADACFGWARKTGDDSPQIVSLWHGDRCLAPKVSCQEFRADLRDAGIGNGCHGFYTTSLAIPAEGCCLVLRAAGRILDFLFYGSPRQDSHLRFAILAAQSTNEDQEQERWQCVCGMCPDNAAYLNNLGNVYLKHGRRVEADKCFFTAMKLTGKWDANALQLPLQDESLSQVEKWNKTLGRYIRSGAAPKSIFGKKFILELFNGILSCQRDPILSIIYKNFAQFYLFSGKISNRKEQGNLLNLFTDKIAVVCYSIADMNYIINIIKELPYFLVDIIIIDKKCKLNRESMSTFLNKYYIKYEIDNPNQYKLILCDCQRKRYSFNNAKNIKFITYTHVIDNKGIMDETDMLICETEMQAKMSHVLFLKHSDDIYSSIELIDHKYKTEISIPGAFHIDGIPDINTSAQYRDELLASYQFKDHTKPLVVYYEDEHSLFGQAIYALNKLADHINIIAKVFNYDRFDKLSKNIPIDNSGTYSDNKLRFAADYILCGALSATFCSGVMLGLYVLPYYSRVLRLHDENKNLYTYDGIASLPVNPLFATSKNIIHANFEYFFDLLKPANILKAIFEPDYKNWYDKNILDIQKKAFGDYKIGGGEKAAEHIVRFASEGTLGKHMDAFYLK